MTLGEPVTVADSGEMRRDTASRAGAGMTAVFLLIPPVVGAVVAGFVLTSPGRVPWVLAASLLLGLVLFLVASPLARRSRGFTHAGYRRAAETAVLGGLSAGAVAFYTLVVYLLAGYREPWSAELACLLFSGLN